MESVLEADLPLTTALQSLASPTRLAIIRALRSPRTLREIEVGQPTPEGPLRPLARQTVREHLDKLAETGVIIARDAERETGRTQEFSVNHLSLFSLSEDLRALAKLRPIVEPDAETVQRQGTPSLRAVRPCLVLLKGIDEGVTFDLRPTEGRREWVIGRSRTAAISLDFDRSISSSNTILRWTGGHHAILDHPESLNGTSVNFRRLAKGESLTLSHGDIVAVGRVFLVYWA